MGNNTVKFTSEGGPAVHGLHKSVPLIVSDAYQQECSGCGFKCNQILGTCLRCGAPTKLTKHAEDERSSARDDFRSINGFGNFYINPV